MPRLDKIDFYTSPTKITQALTEAKTLFGENPPYTVSYDIEGNYIILFESHFTDAVKVAVTDGCVSNMSREELDLWLEFIKYQKNVQNGVRDYLQVSSGSPQQVEAIKALSTWLVDELNGTPHPQATNCFTSLGGN